jgi:hypothetical protein
MALLYLPIMSRLICKQLASAMVGCIREENLLQVVLSKMVHFATFLVKIFTKIDPRFQYNNFFPCTVDFSPLQNFQNFSTMF